MLVLNKGFFVVGMKLCEKEILDEANLLFEDFWGKRLEGWGRLVAVGGDHRTEIITEGLASIYVEKGWFPAYLAFGF